MRTRTRNTVINTPAPMLTRSITGKPSGWVHGLYSSGPTTTWTTSEYSGFSGRVGVEESITDVPQGRDSYNEVTHVKRVWDCPLAPYRAEGESTENGGNAESVSSGLMSAGPANLEYALNLPSISTGGLEAQAIARCSPHIGSSKVSLPVFLGELRDFAFLAGAVRSLWSEGIGKFLAKMPSRTRQLVREPLVRQPKLFVALDLTRKFVIEPFVRDLWELGRSAHKLRQAYARLQRADALVTRGVARTRGSQGETREPSENNRTYSEMNGYVEQIVVAWMRYRIDHDRFKFPSKAEVFLDYFDFDKPLAAAWELTPLSFVLDWFIDIGTWLDDIGGASVEVPITILSKGLSTKTTRAATCSVSFDQNAYTYRFSNVNPSEPITGSLIDTTYSRRNGFDSSSIPLPAVRLPGVSQGFTLLEMLYMNYGR